MGLPFLIIKQDLFYQKSHVIKPHVLWWTHFCVSPSETSCVLVDPKTSCFLMDPSPLETSCVLMDPKTSCVLMDPLVFPPSENLMCFDGPKNLMCFDGPSTSCDLMDPTGPSKHMSAQNWDQWHKKSGKNTHIYFFYFLFKNKQVWREKIGKKRKNSKNLKVAGNYPNI
jgi:hypothetical protein